MATWNSKGQLAVYRNGKRVMVSRPMPMKKPLGGGVKKVLGKGGDVPSGGFRGFPALKRRKVV